MNQSLRDIVHSVLGESTDGKNHYPYLTPDGLWVSCSVSRFGIDMCKIEEVRASVNTDLSFGQVSGKFMI